MAERLPSVDLIVLQDLAKSSAVRLDDQEVLHRLEERGLARKVADDWCITLRGRYSLSLWAEGNTFV